MDALIGKELGLYKIVSKLGTGGMANVYKAHQPSVDRHVAIKVLFRQHTKEFDIFVSRFMQEAQVVAKLEHPHILPVYDFGETDEYLYLVMRLVNSGTLWDRFHGQPFPLEQIRKVTTQIGDALDYAHSKGVIHRDIKPKNILMDDRDNSMLTDFGIAKVLQADLSLTQLGTTLGTPTYMSPEQIQGEPLDGRSDIYALGVILFQLCTGHLPFEADTPHGMSTKHLYADPPSARELNPELPEELEAIINMALAKAPEDRYSTAGDLVHAMQSLKFQKPDLTNSLSEEKGDKDTIPLPEVKQTAVNENSQAAPEMPLETATPDPATMPSTSTPAARPAITPPQPDSTVDQSDAMPVEAADTAPNPEQPRLKTPLPYSPTHSPTPDVTSAPGFLQNRGLYIGLGIIGIVMVTLLGVLIGINLSGAEGQDEAAAIDTLVVGEDSLQLEDDFSQKRLDDSIQADENGIRAGYADEQYVITIIPRFQEDNETGEMVKAFSYVDEQIYKNFIMEVDITEMSSKIAGQRAGVEHTYGLTFRNQGRSYYSFEMSRSGALIFSKFLADEESFTFKNQLEVDQVDFPVTVRIEAVGSNFTIQVGDEIFEFPDPNQEEALEQGAISFLVIRRGGYVARVAFDNLKIWAIE